MSSDANISDIQYLKGVGPKRALLLGSELGVKSVSDLIRIYPFRYVDRSSVIPIAAVRSTAAMVQIRAQVVSVTLIDKAGNVLEPADGQIRFKAANRMSVMVADGTGMMEMVFFGSWIPVAETPAGQGLRVFRQAFPLWREIQYGASGNR